MKLRSLSISAYALLLTLAAVTAHAQDDAKESRHGRKYKAPPPTSHVEVLVLKEINGKPISNAAVIFHPTKDGHDEGNLEVKSDPEGVAKIDVIPTGSKVQVQVIANGYATFAEDYVISEESRQIVVKMMRPQKQVSAYEDNAGKASTVRPGVQEPPHSHGAVAPAKAVKPGASNPAPSTTAPLQTTPPMATKTTETDSSTPAKPQ